MAQVVEYYKDLMYNRIDPRTQDWFLISSPGPVLTIVVTYMYFCISAGPRYMKDKKPYTLRNTLIVYNLIQVLLSMYLVYEGLAAGWWNDYSFKCQPVDYSNNPKALRMARGVYMYFICKLIELLDTVFFVFRKKQRQISFLHVYHHAVMPVCAWVGVRYVAGGHATLLGVINAFVHIVMYFYYMLSAFGPEVQKKHLWWKKYITRLQLIQFVVVFFHQLQVFFNGCNFPKPLAFLLTLNSVVFMYMFGSFYVKNYHKSAKSPATKLEDKSVSMNGNKSIGLKSD